jgi:hypothetical protein
MFVAFALLFHPVSPAGFDGVLHWLGGDGTLYGRGMEVTDGDTPSPSRLRAGAHPCAS